MNEKSGQIVEHVFTFVDVARPEQPSLGTQNTEFIVLCQRIADYPMDPRRQPVPGQSGKLARPGNAADTEKPAISIEYADFNAGLFLDIDVFSPRFSVACIDPNFST